MLAYNLQSKHHMHMSKKWKPKQLKEEALDIIQYWISFGYHVEDIHNIIEQMDLALIPRTEQEEQLRNDKKQANIRVSNNIH